MKQSFQEVVFKICEKDNRYQPEAYVFLIEALDATMKAIFKENPEHAKHVTGKELMEGIRLSIPQRPASLLAHYRQVESRP